jgi:hypothetical protein
MHPITVTLAAAIVLVSCIQRTPTKPDTAPMTHAGGVSPREGDDSLLLDLEVPDSVRLGSPVPITLTVRNATARVLSIRHFGDRPTWNFFVRSRFGPIRYTFRDPIPTTVATTRLAPEDRLRFAGSWNQTMNCCGFRASPGAYYIEAVIITEEPLGVVVRRRVVIAD